MENMSWLAVAFEVVLLAGALTVLLVAVVSGRDRSVWGPIVGVTFALAAVMRITAPSIAWLVSANVPRTTNPMWLTDEYATRRFTSGWTIATAAP